MPDSYYDPPEYDGCEDCDCEDVECPEPLDKGEDACPCCVCECPCHNLPPEPEDEWPQFPHRDDADYFTRPPDDREDS